MHEMPAEEYYWEATIKASSDTFLFMDGAHFPWPDLPVINSVPLDFSIYDIMATDKPRAKKICEDSWASQKNVAMKAFGIYKTPPLTIPCP